MKEGEEETMLIAPEEGTFSLKLNVLVERQPDGKFLAHCLELDLVAEGDSAQAACEEVLNIVDIQVRTCLENDNLENLFFPAPPEVWKKLGRATQHPPGDILRRKFRDPGREHRTVELDQCCYA